MRYYYVNVEDRQTGDCVTVGSMLDLSEVRELIKVLNRFNSCDLLIYYKEESL